MKNKEIIKKYYESWINKNLEGLKKIYHSEVIFNDPVFKNLNHEKTVKMWKMIFSMGTSKKVDSDWKILEDKKDQVVVLNKVKYNFKGNKVLNEITITFKIKDGKIISHTDNFSFQKWLNQVKKIEKQKSKLYYWFIQKATQKVMKKKLKKVSF